MDKLNCWDFADALAMAIRLRKSGECPPDIDDLYGTIVQSIVSMSTLLLVRGGSYARHRKMLTDPDVQSIMTVHALVALDRDVDTSSPKQVINYTIKCVQNRLRNYVRDTLRKDAKLDMVAESEAPCDMDYMSTLVRDLDGEYAYKEDGRKINNKIEM